ncbi:MAG TPA: rRNA adenine N-6-methyltransferase family protein [Beutenbergiaceae bacterium]|nr:rRNA adenine N-6-methyltransferase family protein [Beutenbergiaceae bacterium]
MSGNGHRHQRAWGWHPLRPDWAERLIRDAGVQPGDLVFDLGAGTGALTLPLIEAGADVVAIELHPNRARALRRRVNGRAKVVQADLADLYLPARAFRVVSSPPYAISSALVRTLLGAMSLRSADLVLQGGAARRLASGPPRAKHARRYRLQVGPAVPRRAFLKPPKVDSAVLQIRRASRSRARGAD